MEPVEPEVDPVGPVVWEEPVVERVAELEEVCPVVPARPPVVCAPEEEVVAAVPEVDEMEGPPLVPAEDDAEPQARRAEERSAVVGARVMALATRSPTSPGAASPGRCRE